MGQKDKALLPTGSSHHGSPQPRPSMRQLIAQQRASATVEDLHHGRRRRPRPVSSPLPDLFLTLQPKVHNNDPITTECV